MLYKVEIKLTGLCSFLVLHTYTKNVVLFILLDNTECVLIAMQL